MSPERNYIYLRSQKAKNTMIQYTQTHCFAIEPEDKSLCTVVFGIDYQLITPPLYILAM